MLHFTKENILSVIFGNNERNIISIRYKGEDGQIYPYFIAASPEDKQFQKLLEMYTLDEIETFTLEHMNEQLESLKQYHIQLIESGEATPKTQDSTENPGFINLETALNFFLLQDELGEDEKEILFKLKLIAFEMEMVENASAEDKEVIRTAATPFELIQSLNDLL